MHHRKNCRTLKARQTKSICAGTAIFRDIAIRILVIDISVKANCTGAVQSKKVCFVESCLE
jgi:hypothetical protein